MKKYVVLEKKVGETPLMALKAWKEKNPEYKNVPASYAGRLDPMASGKLLVLFGEECKRQKEYTNLDKEYEIEVLLDVGSDTGDALGLVEYAGKTTPVDNFSRLPEILKAEQGSRVRPYPHFSSKTVNGKPLFLHALEGNLAQISIPTHEEEIYDIQILDSTSLPVEKLQERVADFLARVPRSFEPSKRLGADFRIDAVQKSWNVLFASAGGRTFTIISLRVACGSGTYMRALAPRIGAALGTGALALSIRRTRIGRSTWYTGGHIGLVTHLLRMKYFLIVLAVVLIGAGGWYAVRQQGSVAEPASEVTLPLATTTPTDLPSESATASSTAPMVGAVQEIRVTGSNFAFDPKEIRVKEGTRVRLVFINAAGTHDWVIDEFSARTKILQGAGSDTVEFVANKRGTFEYYCSVGTHRQMGMKGNLIVE